jgi:N,N-dimethylformamidase
MGFDYSMPYRRMPGSFDPRAVFIFQGIGDDEIIGNFGLKQDGACGYEIDSADYEQGTPPHALVLMSCTEFGPDYVQFEEEDYDPEYRPRSIGRDRVRGDVVYFEGPDGGAVFSVGSISWCGSLSHNHYENNVSRITKNVLDRFSS